MTESITVRDVVIAASLIGAGVFVGLVLRGVFGWVAKYLHRTRWDGDEFAAGVLRDLAFVAATIVGLWGAAVSLPLRQALRGAVDRSLVVVLILVGTIFAARLVAGLIRSVALARSGIASSATIFVNIGRIVVFVIGLLVLLQSLGISITPMLTALGVGGLAVALALQDTLANLFAGIHILASKKVEPGDYIKLDSGEEGYVVDVNWRQTTIRQLPNNIVVVPNAKLADAILTNFHQPEQEMSVLVQVGVSYDSDLDQVEQETIEVACEVMRAVEGGVPEHKPFIRYHTFGDSSINFSVILRAAEFTDQYLVTHEFIKRLHTRYRTAGIQIPFPMRTLVMTNGQARESLADLPHSRRGHHSPTLAS